MDKCNSCSSICLLEKKILHSEAWGVTNPIPKLDCTFGSATKKSHEKKILSTSLISLLRFITFHLVLCFNVIDLTYLSVCFSSVFHTSMVRSIRTESLWVLSVALFSESRIANSGFSVNIYIFLHVYISSLLSGLQILEDM